ncbi:MAG: primosomal protein N' [Pseudomonadota bacterium]|nr:primosomal protein N' [Pseudomonadota bacterium]
MPDSDIPGFAAPIPIARIALDTPLDRLFDYQAADACPSDIGRRVEAPFGSRSLIGVLLELADHSTLPLASLKNLHAIDRSTPPLPADLLALARFVAGYYHHPLGAVLAMMLPPALRRAAAASKAPAASAYCLTAAGRLQAEQIPARFSARKALADKLLAGELARSELSPGEKLLIRDWLKQAWVEPALLAAASVEGDAAPDLTEEQALAIASLRESATAFNALLLHGVTGSGKTEVYLQLVADVLARGQQVLVLVPEIHLTPQLMERFARRFPSRKLIGLHSNLAAGERRNAWLDALEGRADIVLGTRLAVFTPLPRLGLIIVDEEHDSAYKQMEGMRYSARDVAVWRARERGIPVLLGSATPALETWRNAKDGRYRLLSLSKRAHAQAVLPKVRLIDSRTDRPRQGLTSALLTALSARLQRGEQSLVFINRRGYAPTLLCNGCGHVFPCSRCSAHLVLHRNKTGYRLVCHHCGLIARPPEACPECGNLDLRPAGQGTQRVEETLAEQFPEARILRIDRDTAARKGAFAEMRDRVEAREIDILVGTQIVAKGHDFPHLTLVGVIGADQALISPDFRASERLFAQLMQVAGRAGRAQHPGEVLIQTAYPRHPLYQSVLRHDYPGFAATALRERRGADFPPYASQALLRAEAREEESALGFLLAAREAGLGLNAGIILFDPVAALMARVANRHRVQLLVQAGARQRLQQFLTAWLVLLETLPAKGVKWTLDVDPLDY